VAYVYVWVYVFVSWLFNYFVKQSQSYDNSDKVGNARRVFIRSVSHFYAQNMLTKPLIHNPWPKLTP